MPRARVTDSLSSEAQQRLAVYLREGLPAAVIAEKLQIEFSETVSERTIARRKAEWEAETRRRQSGREQMEDLLAAMRAGNHTASEMVNALAVEALMRDPDGTLSADPIALQNTSIAAERVRNQAKSMALKERQIALDEQKFAILQARERAAIAATEELEKAAGAGKQVTVDDLRKIKEIYGLKHE